MKLAQNYCSSSLIGCLHIFLLIGSLFVSSLFFSKRSYFSTVPKIVIMNSGQIETKGNKSLNMRKKSI